uniref:TaqI-like C-terminal specificity domain-containing protein n=1 Tax=Parapedobacter tibetensis TaxID=2972951 RepID=UPI00214D561B
RPILLGKDIKRYKFEWDQKWILFTRRGIEISLYPAIEEYLYQYYEDLRPRNNGELTGRKPGPYKWYEIQDNVAYFEEFEGPKIAWGNLALRSQFAFIPEGYYINAPSSFIGTDNLFLLALLNSKVGNFYIKQLGVSRKGGYIEYKPMFVEQLPVPDISAEQQDFFIEAVRHLLTAQNDAERQILEQNIDNEVYKLYDFNTEEVNCILSV